MTTLNAVEKSVANAAAAEKKQIDAVVAVIESLPANARQLFFLYVRDAGNWSGTPLVGGNVRLLGVREDRGLLSHIKQAGLVTTDTDEGCTWLHFTALGRLAYERVMGEAWPDYY